MEKETSIAGKEKSDQKGLDFYSGPKFNTLNRKLSQPTAENLKKDKLIKIGDEVFGPFKDKIIKLVNNKELTEDEAGMIQINFNCHVCKKNVTRDLDDITLFLSHACSTKCFKVHG